MYEVSQPSGSCCTVHFHAAGGAGTERIPDCSALQGHHDGLHYCARLRLSSGELFSEHYHCWPPVSMLQPNVQPMQSYAHAHAHAHEQQPTVDHTHKMQSLACNFVYDGAGRSLACNFLYNGTGQLFHSLAPV